MEPFDGATYTYPPSSLTKLSMAPLVEGHVRVTQGRALSNSPLLLLGPPLSFGEG